MTWLLMCFGAFGGAVGAHAMFCRLEVGIDRVVRFLLVATLAAVLLVFALRMHYAAYSVEFLTALLVFGFACELYIFLFTMTISSISSNILVHLARRTMTVQEVTSRYDSKDMVRVRLERLIDTGLLSTNRNVLALSAKGARLTRTFDALRTAFRHSAVDG